MTRNNSCNAWKKSLSFSFLWVVGQQGFCDQGLTNEIIGVLHPTKGVMARNVGFCRRWQLLRWAGWGIEFQQMRAPVTDNKRAVEAMTGFVRA